MRDRPGLPRGTSTRAESGGSPEWIARTQASGARGLLRRVRRRPAAILDPHAQEPSLALEYPADDRTAVVNILSGCIDVSAAILETFSSYQKLPLAQSNCMAEGFARLELSRDVIVALVDGEEPDPFANSDRYASGLASLAVECMEEDDLLPNGLLPKLPAPKNAPGSTTTSTTVPTSDDDLLEGIEPGSPLDTTTTTSG